MITDQEKQQIQVSHEELNSLTYADLIALINYFDEKLQLSAENQDEIRDKLIILEQRLENKLNLIFIN